MPLHPSIEQSINQYNSRFASFLRKKNPSIVKIETLPDQEKSDLFSVYECFLPDPPDPISSPNTYKVYRSVLDALFPLHAEELRTTMSNQSDFRHGPVEDGLVQLHERGLGITRENYRHLKHAFDALPASSAGALDSSRVGGDFFAEFFSLVQQMSYSVTPFDQEAINTLCLHATINFKKFKEILSKMASYGGANNNRNKKDKLTQHEFSEILSSPHSHHIITCLWAHCFLSPPSNYVPPLSRVQFERIMHHPRPDILAEISENIVHRNIRLSSTFYSSFTYALDILTMSAHPTEILPWLLQGEWVPPGRGNLFEHLYHQRDRDAVPKVLDWLWEHGDHATKEKFTSSRDHNIMSPKLPKLAKILCLCANSNALSQENVSSLFNLFDRQNYLLTEQGEFEIWGRIPEHQLSAVVIRELLQRASRENPRESLQAYVTELLFPRHIAAVNAVPPVVFNASQSTHTASVHRTISESATKLNQHYGAAITGHTDHFFHSKLDAKLEEIQAWVHRLPTGVPKYDAAKRCIDKLLNPSHTFVDQGSHISLQQIIALTWIAIHDDTMREGSLQGDNPSVIGGALGLFIDGLYEIQRGYNLSATGVDLGQADSSICTAGTFNKCVEKLWGIHPFVQLEYITPAYASTKLQIVAKEEMLKYLTNERDEARRVLDNTDKEHWDDMIWSKIRIEVENRMIDEFSSLYDGNKNNPNFQALLEMGGIAITPSDIEKILSEQDQRTTDRVKDNPSKSTGHSSDEDKSSDLTL